MITENFDFSGMSEIDYTDTFADIDLAAEIIGNFTNALRRDLRLTNNLIPDNFDVGASDLISMDDVKNIGNILSWDAEKVIRRFEVHKLFCTVILRPGEGGLIDFNTRFGIP